MPDAAAPNVCRSAEPRHGRGAAVRPLGALLGALSLAACGARTELLVPEGRRLDGGLSRPDVALDDARAADASHPPACACHDEENTSAEPAETCVHGVAWLAWEYAPSCSFEVTSIDLHTSSGEVALLDDDGGRPGRLLARGTLSGPSERIIEWRAATLVPPVSVDGGRTYWIGERVMDCSTAASGIPYAYYGGDTLDGPWTGPYSGHVWTARIVGVCP